LKRLTLFITGSDTGVGKTLLAALLTRHLRLTNIPAVALKPVCSGSRADARKLFAAAEGALTLHEINPWHFRAPLAPLLAARLEKRKVKLAQVVAHVRRIQNRFPVLIIEGAGGLFSPLGEGFDSLDLIKALRASVIVACPNRLGAVNQARLVLAPLPSHLSPRAQVVLTGTVRPEVSSSTNPRLLREMAGVKRIHVLPRLKRPWAFDRVLANRRIRRVMQSLADTPPKSLPSFHRRHSPHDGGAGHLR
jgi:dethiobiotin synthetase